MPKALSALLLACTSVACGDVASRLPTAPSATAAIAEAAPLERDWTPPLFQPAFPQPHGLAACPVTQTTRGALVVAKEFQSIVAEVLRLATGADRRQLATFVIRELDRPSASISGELYRRDVGPDRSPDGPRLHIEVYPRPPGVMRFANQLALLETMRAAVLFDAEVRLHGRDLVPMCRPKGRLTGRIEGRL